MTNDQLTAHLTDLNAKLDANFARIDNRFERIDQRFETIDQRFENIERHMVTKQDVFAAVLQGIGFLFAAIVGTVVVLNALGAFGPMGS